MSNDIEIIKDCLNGNQLAYKQLYEKYISYCYGMCIRYSVSKTEIKDLVQIIFSQVFHSLKNYDADKAIFKTWFTRICINQILSYRRKGSRGLQMQDVEDLEQVSTSFEDNSVESSIDREYILSLIKQMPENYQIVFNLFVIDGFSHKEISEQLNITSQSSRVILNRARGWLKNRFVAHINS